MEENDAVECLLAAADEVCKVTWLPVSQHIKHYFIFIPNGNERKEFLEKNWSNRIEIWRWVVCTRTKQQKVEIQSTCNTYLSLCVWKRNIWTKYTFSCIRCVVKVCICSIYEMTFVIYSFQIWILSIDIKKNLFEKLFNFIQGENVCVMLAYPTLILQRSPSSKRQSYRLLIIIQQKSNTLYPSIVVQPRFSTQRR